MKSRIWKSLWLLTVLTLTLSPTLLRASDLEVDDLTAFGASRFYGDVLVGEGAVPSEGLKLYYAFNTSATHQVDLSGNNITGTHYSVVWTASGLVEGAHSYTAATTARVAFDMSGLYGATAGTACAWVRLPTNPATWQYAIGADNDGGGGTQIPFTLLWLNNSGSGTNAHTFIWIDTTTGGTTQASIQLGRPNSYFWDGAWHFVACMWDGTQAWHYIDGDTDTPTATASGTLWNTNRLALIGNSYNSGSIQRNWRGEIDEVRLYNRVLSPSELNRLLIEERSADIDGGEFRANDGIQYLAPLGDLGMGSYTNQL